MHRYASEAAFRKDLCKKLEAAAWFTQKLESEGMNAGIPDLFIGYVHKQFFIELKLEKCPAPKGAITVHWRPGQQAWAFRYFVFVQVPVITAVQYDDKIAVILEGAMIYKGNRVPEEYIKYFENIDKFIDYLRSL